MTTMLRPVARGDRHIQLDLMRGLAVLGILAVNIESFALPFEAFIQPELSLRKLVGDEARAWWTVATFFEFKFVTLFSMLFGVSVWLVGGERSDEARGALLRRRLIWLAVFGLIHGVAIWYGDILLLYAWSGLFMLLMRSWKPAKLFWIGLAVVLVGSAFAVGQFWALEFAPPEVQKQVLAGMGGSATAADVQASVAAMRAGVGPAFVENLSNWAFLQFTSLLVFVFRTVALMMIGLALFKWGFLTGRAPVWVYLLLIVAAAGSLWLVGVSNEARLASNFAMPASAGRYSAANQFLALVISLGYASTLILLARIPVIRRLLTPLARAGQMAFTNYLMQSIILTTIFTAGRGLGLFGQFGHAQLWLFVFAVWALELVWSPLWLARFRMGPLEWIWRRLTYGRNLQAPADDQPQPSATAP